MIPFSIVGQMGGHKSVQFSSEATQNMYIDYSEGANLYGIHDFPGLKSFASGNGTDRGTHVMDSVLYGIQSNSLYSISSGSTTSLGTVPGTERAIFADDGTNLYFVADKVIYKWDRITISTVTQAAVADPSSIAYINRQFIISGNNGLFSTSDVADGDTYNALNVAEAEVAPDPLIRPYIFTQAVYMMGGRTTELWYNTGVGSPPFARQDTALVNVGLAGKYAVTNTDQFLYWLGDDKKVYQGVGASARPVNTSSVSNILEAITVSDCIASRFVLDGQDFVVFAFPTANKTLLFSEKFSYWINLSSEKFGDRWYGNNVIRAYDQNLAVDYRTGDVYTLDKDTFTDNGDTRIRLRTMPPFTGKLINRQGRRVLVSTVRIKMQVGVGLATGQGSAPVIMCALSEDGGQTWGAEEQVPIGVMGDYLIAVDFDQFASGYDVRFRLSCSDPVYLSIFEGLVDIQDDGD